MSIPQNQESWIPIPFAYLQNEKLWTRKRFLFRFHFGFIWSQFRFQFQKRNRNCDSFGIWFDSSNTDFGVRSFLRFGKKVFVEVRTEGIFFSCCAARQENKCRRYFPGKLNTTSLNDLMPQGVFWSSYTRKQMKFQGDHGAQRLGFVEFDFGVQLSAQLCMGSCKLSINCRAVRQHCGTSLIQSTQI